MEKTLIAQKNPQGVGLAAPQVGFNLAVFIIKPTPEAKTEVFINPRILRYGVMKTGGPGGGDPHSGTSNAPATFDSGAHPDVASEEHWGGGEPGQDPSAKNQKRKKTKLEGCLSIPRFWAAIKRADKVLLEYQTTDGQTQSKWFSDFKAMIIQHEVDHLRGILFTQKALEQNVSLYEEKEGELKPVDY